jgi:outer membrane protein TolC
MPQDSPRELGRADTSELRATNLATLGLASLAFGLAGCVAYEPAPIDLADVLDGLDARRLASVMRAGSGEVPRDGVRPAELAAFAVTSNPALVALRAETGVGRALLVEAGLLPDPELGWDAMDVLASRIVDGMSTSVDALSGLGLMFPLLRPGERDARERLAESRLDEVRHRVLTAEWELTRDVYLAAEEVHAAEELHARTRALADVATSTSDYFRRAREAGTATGIQANLALGELQAIRLGEARAEMRVRRARQELNALLGLPPDLALEVVAAEDPSARVASRRDPEELARLALRRRPDLAELEARYRTAEEGVRLAIAQQYPMVALGTGVRLSLPVFSRWGRPAIDAALARRARSGHELTAAVHDARREIAAAHTDWSLAERELALVESELLPNAEASLALAREAFQEGELTLLETLALQRALVEARTRHAEIRAEKRKRAWSLLAASGLLLGTNPTDDSHDEEVSR